MKPQPQKPPLSGTQIVDEYFIENRTRLLEIAAFLDRLDRIDPSAASLTKFPASRTTKMSPGS